MLLLAMRLSAFCRCLSVRLSVRPSRSCILSKPANISSIFFHHRVASHSTLAFRHQTLWQYSDWDAANEAVECRWGMQKLRFSTNILLHRVLSTVRPPSIIHTAAPDRGKLVTLIAERRRLLFAVDGRRSVYVKKPHRYAKENRKK